MTVWDVQGHFLIQIPAVPLLWRLKRKATLISFFHICPGGNRESGTGIFSSKWLRMCVCLLHLPYIASGGTQLERKTPKGYCQKRGSAGTEHTPKFLHLYFSYPWQMKTSLWIYLHLALPFLPFSIPPSSHTCSMQISSDGSESGHAEEPDACAGFTVEFIYL